MVSKENKNDKAPGSGGKYYPKEFNEQSEKPNKKFDKRKIRCHNCNLLGHFKSECKKPPKERALMAEEGDEGDMILMCELVDAEDPVVQAWAEEIVALMDENVCLHGQGPKTHVDAIDVVSDSETRSTLQTWMLLLPTML